MMISDTSSAMVISTLPNGHYRTVNASVFPDSNQDDDDDSERNVSETNSASHHKDQDLDAWLKFFEEEGVKKKFRPGSGELEPRRNLHAGYELRVRR